MQETVYDAEPELRRPAHYFRASAIALRLALPIGWRLFRSNLRVRYRRSWLGYVWLLVPALGTAALAAFIQARRIVSFGDTGLPYPLFVLTGIVLWQAFAEAVQMPLQQIQSGRQLVTRSRVPHEAVILAGTFELLLNAGIRLLLILPLILLARLELPPSLLLVPTAVLALVVLGLGVGLLLAPIGLLYDDVGRGLGMLLGFGIFLTPVIYPIPAGSPLRFNPVAPVLDTARGWIAGTGSVGPYWAVVASGAALLVLAWLFYRVARPHVVARLG